MSQFTTIDFDPFSEGNEIEKLTFTNEPQREIWLSCFIGGDDANRCYNESVSLKFTGNLSVENFQKAIKEVIQRHEALRATVSSNGEKLIIYKTIPTVFDFTDLTTINEAERKKEFTQFLNRTANTVFNITDEPLFKVFLHKTNEQEYYFTLLIHHLIGDGWSIGIILDDLCKFYNAFAKGEILALPPAAQISEYVEAQEKFFKTETYKTTENYWLDLYEEEIPVLDLPIDNPRKSPRTYHGKRYDHTITKECVAQLKAVGANAGAGFVTTLLAAFEIFLYQCTHQRSLIVGLPSSGQAASGLEDVVGHCVNLLPIKANIQSAETFKAYLKRHKKEVLDAYDHQRITFGELLKKLYIPRDPSRVALVPVMFNVDMGMDNQVAFEGLQHELISNPRAFENFEIYLNASNTKDGMVLEWSYNTALFHAETIQNFSKQFETILKNIVSNDEQSIASIINTNEGKINFCEGEKITIADEQTLLGLLDKTTQKFSHKTAVRCNQTSLSYEQLQTKADQLASLLLSQGIAKGDIVAVALERSVEMIVSLLAVMKTGAAYLPIDPEYPQERISFMLKDSGAKLIVTKKQHLKTNTSKAAELFVEDVWQQLETVTKQKQLKPIVGQDLAYLLYTSGSTGKPKGVKITHRNLVNFLLSMQEAPGIKDSDKLLAVTSISFDIAGLELYLPLIAGAELIIADKATIRDGRLLLENIAQNAITIMQATPSTWQMLLDAGWQKPFALKALTGGEALPFELAKKLLPLCKELWNMYGPTETTIWSTIKKITPADEQITIGKPIHNTQVYIMDEDGNPLPTKQTGEIYIGGEGVAEGYFHREELTADKFVADKFSKLPNKKLYRTGDIGKLLENGELQCVGRVDFQVKIRGHRIELGEIENCIAAIAPIKQCVVLAREDAPGDKRLVAYVTLNEDAFANVNTSLHSANQQQNEVILATEKLTSKEINVERDLVKSWKRQLEKELPAFMIPQDFVVLNFLPLTPNTKIDRKALPKPQRKHNAETHDSRALTQNEKVIASIWEEVLQMENLKPSDDFFLLGGHSLLAVKVMVALEKITGKRLTIATLFENATIEKLAIQLEKGSPIINETKIDWEVLVPIKKGGNKMPVFFVHGADLNVFLFKTMSQYLDDDQPVYGLQALGIYREADIPATFEEITKKYVADILKVYPQGPYAIAGYSLGGFIAFEIAKQLQQMGKEVALLGIIDTFAGNHFEGNRGKKVKHELNKIAFLAKTFVAHPQESLTYHRSVLRQKFRARFVKDGDIPENMLTIYEEGIYKKYSDAFDNYKLTPFDIKLTMFAVQKRLYYVEDLLTLGWKKFANEGVNTYPIQGDHTTVLYPPNDKVLATVIQKVLNGLAQNHT